MQAFWRATKDSVVLAVAAAFVMNGVLFGLWAARVPAFKARFDLEPATLGGLLLVLALGAILAFPFGGAIMERRGVKATTLVCAFGYVPACICLALAPNVFTLAIALFVFGAFHGAMDIAMNGWAAAAEKRLNANIMSVFHALFSLGAGLGAASGYWAGQTGLSLELHFLSVAICAGLLALPLIWKGREDRQRKQSQEQHPLFAWPTQSLFLVGLIAFASALGEGAMADWSAVYLRFELHATEAYAALGYTVFSVAMVIVRLLGGVLTTRLGAVAMARSSGVVASTGLIIVVLAARPEQAFAGFVLIGMGYAVLMPLVFSRAANDPCVPAGPALAGVATLGYGGMLLGPPIVGFLAQLFSLAFAFLVLAVLALTVVFLAPQLGRGS